MPHGARGFLVLSSSFDRIPFCAKYGLVLFDANFLDLGHTSLMGPQTSHHHPMNSAIPQTGMDSRHSLTIIARLHSGHFTTNSSAYPLRKPENIRLPHDYPLA